MDGFQAVYVVAEDADYGRWIRSFWQGQSPAEDPLRQLLEPEDLRGEVAAWGEWPHWTITDALTTTEAQALADIVKAICGLCPPPALTPTGLKTLAGTTLAVKCTSPALDNVRTALIEATRHLIARAPLADEEFQKAEWWIRKTGASTAANIESLWNARQRYVEAGAPPLPSSRHFRLGFLVRLCKQIERAPKGDQEANHRHLRYFLTRGEPHWYAGPGSLHTSIASGLRVKNDEDRATQLERFDRTLWPAVQSRLGSYRPDCVGIMGESPRENVTVRFFDWLTETFVEETRPVFSVIDRAYFARP